MRRLFPGRGTHDRNTKLLSRLDAAIEFHFATLVAFSSLWERFQRYFLEYRELGFSLDISRMKFPEDLFERMRPQIEQAFAAMRELEAGAIANPTEKRMVGHHWLRNPAVFYGSLVNINAYDQPGVEEGKKAASELLELQK